LALVVKVLADISFTSKQCYIISKVDCPMKCVSN